MGDFSNSNRVAESVAERQVKYRLDPTKVLTAPIVNRIYYTKPVEIVVERPLNPSGQEQESRTVDLTRVNYEVTGFGPVDGKKQACKDYLVSTAINTSSKCLYPCGDVWELYQYYDEYGQPYRMAYGYTLAKPADNKQKTQDSDKYLGDVEDLLDIDTPAEQLTNTPVHAYDPKAERQRYVRKIKKTVRRLINANRLTYMYTLTFALELDTKVPALRFVLPEHLQRDRQKILEIWNKRLTYIRRALKQRYDRDFRFVLVPEIHDSDQTDPRKRGTYHLHLATDKPIDKAELQALWGYGVVWVDNFGRSKSYNKDTNKYETHDRDILDDPGRYMAKYMDKDFDSFEDFAAWKQHKYSSSRNLQRPEKLKIRDEQAIALALKDPQTVYDFEGVSKVQAAKVRALGDINTVKTYEGVYGVDVRKWDKDKGEMATVKMQVRYTCYNFRLLLPGAIRGEKNLEKKVKKKLTAKPAVRYVL